MALITREEITQAFSRLGELAIAQGDSIELIAVGGAAMVLAFDARQSTHDVDVAVVLPREARIVRELAKRVALERDWPEDWLNDAAKGYLVGFSEGQILFAASGILVRAPALEQLLAMKLSAWRDDVDIADARRLLVEMMINAGREVIWKKVEPFLVPGDQLKAQYAFDDLWESVNGQS
jgi:predicted nucleotidyltransferase